jgi:sugar porter (SP) family MFS transporter
MKLNRVHFAASTVALAGFLFGFDTVVISGANLPIKQMWPTSPVVHGLLVMSMALWGTVVGALFGGIPSDRWGRKTTLLLIGGLYTFSAIGSALASELISFSVFRFIGGLAVGCSSVTCPTYISEVSPASHRGRLVARYQFMIVFGILAAYISNYALEGVGGTSDWRLMLGIEAIPAVLYTLLVTQVPKSPRWLLIHQGKKGEAQQVLKGLNYPNEEEMIEQICSSQYGNKPTSLFQRRYMRPLLLAFFLAFFNQMSGINFVLYYAPEILQRAGLAVGESLFGSVFIGIFNLVFTLIGLRLIDRVGRKQLLIIGSFGYIGSLILVALAFMLHWSPTMLLVGIVSFVASHAIGQGAVIWVILSEIFPNSVRAKGQAFGSGVHWVMAALITLVTPIFLDRDEGIFGQEPSPIFFFFAAMMVIQLIYVWKVVPETKGKKLEEIYLE